MEEINICSIVTKDAYEEFLLMKKSIEQFHVCSWYLATDSYVSKKAEGMNNVTSYRIVNDQTFTHGVKDVKSNVDFYDMLLKKFEIIKIALKENNYVIFLDTDMIFLNSIEDDLLELISNKKVDIVLTPHYTRDKLNENRVGFFNAGMFMVNNIQLIEEWQQLCLDEENQYYEQPPLEKIVELYRCIILPINYNVGWWRFKQSFGAYRYAHMDVVDGKICLFGRPIVNIHLHTLKKLSYENYGSQLFDYILDLSNKLEKKDKVYLLLRTLKGR